MICRHQARKLILDFAFMNGWLQQEPQNRSHPQRSPRRFPLPTSRNLRPDSQGWDPAMPNQQA